jgi:hypothetical protein
VREAEGDPEVGSSGGSGSYEGGSSGENSGDDFPEAGSGSLATEPDNDRQSSNQRRDD